MLMGKTYLTIKKIKQMTIKYKIVTYMYSQMTILHKIVPQQCSQEMITVSLSTTNFIQVNKICLKNIIKQKLGSKGVILARNPLVNPDPSNIKPILLTHLMGRFFKAFNPKGPQESVVQPHFHSKLFFFANSHQNFFFSPKFNT